MAEEKASTRDILKLIAIGGIVMASIVIPNLPIALGAAYKEWKKYNRRDVGKIIKRLNKQEMISIVEENGKTKIEVTEKGKKRLLEYDFANMQLKAKKRDGKWRLVVFDIPENKKRNRDAFRKKLLELDFERVQDSVFASAFPCKKEIDFLCQYLDISDFVTLATVDRIERGEQLNFRKLYVED